jgi:hypothetical protein
MTSSILWIGLGIGAFIIILIIGVIVYLYYGRTKKPKAGTVTTSGFPKGAFVLKYSNGQCINPQGGTAKEGIPIVLNRNCSLGTNTNRIQFQVSSNGALQNVEYPNFCVNSTLIFDDTTNCSSSPFKLNNGNLELGSSGQCVISTGQGAGTGNTGLTLGSCSSGTGPWSAVTAE